MHSYAVFHWQIINSHISEKVTYAVFNWQIINSHISEMLSAF